MRYPRLRAVLTAAVAVAGLSACAEDYNNYGYAGLSARNRPPCDPYYSDCGSYGYGGYGGYGYGGYGYGGGYGWNGYYGDPYWGWWGDYYYPGIGFYIYDSYGRRYPWNEQYRRYWEGRRGAWGTRNWNDPNLQRWDGYRRGNGTDAWRGVTWGRPSGNVGGQRHGPSGGMRGGNGGGGRSAGGHSAGGHSAGGARPGH